MAFFRCNLSGGVGKDWFSGFSTNTVSNSRSTGTIGDFPVSATSTITIPVPAEIKEKYIFSGGAWSADGKSYTIPIKATAVASIVDQKLKIDIPGKVLSITKK